MTKLKIRLLLGVVVFAVMAAVPALAQAGNVYTVSQPRLSATPTAGTPFTVWGVIMPKATAAPRTVVKIRLCTKVNGHLSLMNTYRATLSKRPAGKPGTKYARAITIPAKGSYAVRAIHYRGGKIVAKSKLTYFIIARRIDIDSNVNGWLAPALRDTMAPAGKPLDIVFSTPADWAAPWPSSDKPPNGAAHFIWGDFAKVSADGLIWHTSGLRAGRYDWMRDAMPKWGTGCLVVAQRIAVDKNAHVDTPALAHLPADVNFGDVSAAGMGCDRSIAFDTRVFTQTSADPLIWHTAGLDYGRYDWKCWMDDCHYGTLAVTAPAQTINVDSDVNGPTVAPANVPLDLVFSPSARMACWRTMFFTTAGDLTKTLSYPDPLTWYTGGLPAGDYYWQCWMGPQCHGGYIHVE